MDGRPGRSVRDGVQDPSVDLGSDKKKKGPVREGRPFHLSHFSHRAQRRARRNDGVHLVSASIARAVRSVNDACGHSRCLRSGFWRSFIHCFSSCRKVSVSSERSSAKCSRRSGRPCSRRKRAVSSRTSRASSIHRTVTKPHTGARTAADRGDRRAPGDVAQHEPQDPGRKRPAEERRQLDRRRDLELGLHPPHDEAGEPGYGNPEQGSGHREGKPERQERPAHEDVPGDGEEAVAAGHVPFPGAEFVAERRVPLHLLDQAAVCLRVRFADPFQPSRKALQARESRTQPFPDPPRHPPRLAHVELLRHLHQDPVAVALEVQGLTADPPLDPVGEPGAPRRRGPPGTPRFRSAHPNGLPKRTATSVLANSLAA